MSVKDIEHLTLYSTQIKLFARVLYKLQEQSDLGPHCSTKIFPKN